MSNITNKEFDNVFTDIISLSDKVKDKSVKDRLERASELVLMASQQHLLGITQGVDLTMLGVRNDRINERRAGDRRHTR